MAAPARACESGGVSSRARLRVTLVALLLSVPLAELLLRWTGPSYSASAARARVEQRIEYVVGDAGGDPVPSDGQGSAPQKRALNPYYGYDMAGGFELIERYVDMHAREDRQALFTILFCGGSVPEIFVGFRLGGAERLAELLTPLPQIAGRSVQICRLARAGYKQPQQLQKLAYFLSRGCTPDVVVNIDGLNEVRAGTRNLLFGVHPTWPSSGHWMHLSAGPTGSPESLDAFFEAGVAKQTFLDDARSILDRGLYRSAILGLWSERRLDREFDAWLSLQEAYVAALAADRAPREVTPEDEAAALEICVENWSESSRLMHALCRDRGIAYLHLLQPTLHDEGSKTISKEEWEAGVGEEGLDPFIAAAYDRLREEGVRLVEDGVPFVDTSQIFADIEDQIYYDRTHFGKAGNRLLAERVALELVTRM